MRNEFRALLVCALSVGLTGPAIAQERQTLPSFSYSEGIKNGACKIAFRARDGETMVDFGLGIMDSVFTVDVVKNRWDIIDGEDLATEDIPVMLTFQNGQSTSSEYGGFRDGMYQGIWGKWHRDNNDRKQSQNAFEKLMNATSAAVSFDGDDLVVVNLGAAGLAANKLLDCAISEREKLSN